MGWRSTHSLVKTPTPGEAIHKWQDDHHCRGFPERARGQRPRQGLQPGVAARGGAGSLRRLAAPELDSGRKQRLRF